MEELLNIRRTIHQHPELGFQEFNTSQLLKQSLLSKGLPADCIVPCAHPGFYADVYGSAPAASEPRCVALRAELDALAMQERNEDLSYRSVVPNVAHMCGHDGHMTILLGTAWSLLTQRDRFPSNYKVRFLFQPSEEMPPGGSQAMIKEGCLEGVDEVYGLHLAHAPLGKTVCRMGAMTSAGASLEIHISNSEDLERGDCILAGAEIIQQLMSIIPRDVSCFDHAVVSLCMVSTDGNTKTPARNMKIEGTTRMYSPETQQLVHSRIHTIVQSISSAHHCTGVVSIEEGYPAILNHSSHVPFLRSAISQVLGPASLLPSDPGTASEDFSRFLQHRPGAFLFLGNGVENVPHMTNFKFTEENLDLGMRLWLTLLGNRFGVEFDLDTFK